MRRTINHNYVSPRQRRRDSARKTAVVNGIAATFVAIVFAVALAGFITP